MNFQELNQSKKFGKIERHASDVEVGGSNPSGPAMKKKTILFVCKGNRYRSRIAEELFNRKPLKGFAAESAGVTFQKYNSRATKQVLKEIGIGMSKRKPKKLSKQMIESASRIIVFAGVKFSSKKAEIWPVEDCHAGDVKCVRSGRKRIEKLVENL